jgi:hypothetical protein
LPDPIIASDFVFFETTYLNLSDSQVQESHTVTNFDSTLGTNATHSGTETTVQLQDGQLSVNIDSLVGADFRQVGVRKDLLRLGGLDLGPVANSSQNEGVLAKEGYNCHCLIQWSENQNIHTSSHPWPFR